MNLHEKDGKMTIISSFQKHLSDAEFERYFKMTKQQYDAQKRWKQEILKKKLGLF